MRSALVLASGWRSGSDSGPAPSSESLRDWGSRSWSALAWGLEPGSGVRSLQALLSAPQASVRPSEQASRSGQASGSRLAAASDQGSASAWAWASALAEASSQSGQPLGSAPVSGLGLPASASESRAD